MLDNTDVHQFHNYFGRRIRTIRKSRDFSVEFMVETMNELKTEMSISMYNRIERGTAKASVHVSFLIAEILHCTVYDFLPPQQGKVIPESYADKANRILSDKLRAIENIIRAQPKEEQG